MKIVSFILLCFLGYTSAAQAPVKENPAPLSFGIGLNPGVIPGVDAGLQVTRFVGTRLKVGYFCYNDYPYDA